MPRVVPIWFHWDGEEIVLGSPPDAPKVGVLPDNSKVALTIDRDEFPYRALLVRGGELDAALPEDSRISELTSLDP
jgi:nitroimidazol reductase NimA-like FMN-containing flavoprotein (pyridoxamine 5'-phosphate oxidase superfamily)